jgi:hypothetical protein
MHDISWLLFSFVSCYLLLFVLLAYFCILQGKIDQPLICVAVRANPLLLSEIMSCAAKQLTDRRTRHSCQPCRFEPSCYVCSLWIHAPVVRLIFMTGKYSLKPSYTVASVVQNQNTKLALNLNLFCHFTSILLNLIFFLGSHAVISRPQENAVR